MLDGWDEDTQQKLKSSKVFIAGVGGLGCPAALNLAIAGVGHIVLCDSDTVDISNLNRQFLHAEAGIGAPKTASARNMLSRLNSEVGLEAVNRRITAENVEKLIDDADIIIDCLDNFSGRFILNKYMVARGIPLVHGAVWGMEGRISFFNPPATPCLACLFPASPAADTAVPVLGGVTSAVGSMQAIEAINYLTGEFANIISANEFVNMPNYKAIVRLLSGKEAGRIFTLNCLYEQVPRNGTLVNRLIELSRQQYATPLAEVENFLTQKREFIRKQCKALQLLKEIE